MRQRGFTLIELVVTLAIGGVILLGVMLSINQVILGTDRSNSQTVAVIDAAQAVRAIKRDLMMTQNTNLTDGGPPQSTVNLTWTDYSSFISENWTLHTSIYALSGSNLERTYDGATSIVGRNISSIAFSQNGKVISVNITATGPPPTEKSETLVFSSFIRTEEVE